MNIREQELKAIANEFAVWQNRLSLLGSLNLHDANIFAEFSIQELLNLVFGYRLTNANSQKPNFPAVDLVDDQNRIAVQVTSDPKTKKVQQSINSFIQNKLYNEYDELYIFVLGIKQVRYNSLILPSEISFLPEKHIIDFKTLLRHVSFLPTNKIIQVKRLVLKESSVSTNTHRKSSSRIQRNLNLKKKLQKDFLMEILQKHREYATYEPWIKFAYHNVILRDPDDKRYPEVREGRNNNWLKGEFWDFYDRGIEFITHGGEAVFDKNGYWDILDYRGDSRRENPEYEVRNYFEYPRLAYDNIEAYDMETEPYYGLPTIYCHFKNGNPYEEINIGSPGVFERKMWRTLYDNEKRKKEGWY